MRDLFASPWRPTLAVLRDSGMWGPRGILLSLLPVRIAWAAYIRRRVPRRILQQRLLARRNRYSSVVVNDGGGPYRGALLVAAAPREADGLHELIDSLRCYEGHDIKVVVADDLTGEYPDSRVVSEFPGIDFVRPRVASGSGLCAFRTLQAGLRHIAERYDVPVILKADPDSLLIAPGAFDRARELFENDPGIGVLGTTRVNATGTPTEFRWAGWMAHPELRWSARFRHLTQRAKSAVGTLEFAQAGGYFFNGDAIRDAHRSGELAYRQPQWSLQVDDVITALVIQTTGRRTVSWGAPGDPIASDTLSLPMEPAELVEGGFCVVHSVRGTPQGMSEPDVRAYFGERRRSYRPVEA